MSDEKIKKAEAIVSHWQKTASQYLSVQPTAERLAIATTVITEEGCPLPVFLAGLLDGGQIHEPSGIGIALHIYSSTAPGITEVHKILALQRLAADIALLSLQRN